MNGVAVAPRGLILWENGAASSRKVFECPPGLPDAIKISKFTDKVPKPRKYDFSIFLPIVFIYCMGLGMLATCIYIYIQFFIICHIYIYICIFTILLPGIEVGCLRTWSIRRVLVKYAGATGADSSNNVLII